MENPYTIGVQNQAYRIAFKTFISDLPAIQCVRYDEDSNFIAAGGNGKIIVVTSAKMHTINCEDSITSVCWKPRSSGSKTKNVILASESEGAISQWHTTSRKCLHRLQTPCELYSVDYHKHFPLFVSGGKDGIIRLYDDITKTLINEFDQIHTSRVFCVKSIAEDPNVLLSGGWDSTLQIWDIREKAAVRTLLGPHICGEAIDYKNGEVLAGSWREKHALQIFSMQSGTLIKDINLNTHSWIYSTRFADEGNWIVACGSNNNQVAIIENYEQIGNVQNFPQPLFSCDITKSHKTIVAGCGDGSLSLFNILQA
jgi:WD40 repeat protein